MATNRRPTTANQRPWRPRFPATNSLTDDMTSASRFLPLRTVVPGVGRLILSVCCCLCAIVVSAATFDLETATIADVNAAFKSGALTSEKLTQLYLARIA